MNNTFSDIYDQFLTYTVSCTFADIGQDAAEEQMSKYLLRALGDFRFPQVSLDYKSREIETGEGKTITEYYFVDEEFGQKEINVILSLMKKYYLETLVSREKNYLNVYYDADTRTHSQAAMLQQLLAAYKTAAEDAKQSQQDYSRHDKKHQARIGKVNV